MESECYRYAPPGTPSSITYLTSVSPGQAITVSWSNVSTADRYELQYRYQNTNGTWESWQTVSSSLTGTSRSFTVSSSSSYNAIQFRVLADNSHTMRDTHYGTDIPTGGKSGWRTGSTATIKRAPATPGVFTAPTSDVTAGSSVTVRWGATSSWGNPTSGSNYRLQVRYNGGSWSDVATTGTTASRAYTISSTSSYNTVQFRVRAESGGGNSSYVYTSTVDIVPGQPPSISYPSSVTAGDNISVSWEAGPGAYTYQLQRRYRNTDGTYTSWSTVYTGSSRSATVATASNKGYTDVQFRVRAEKSNGKASSYREGSTATLVKSPSAPGAFTAPTSAVAAGSTVTVKWGATSYWGHPASNNNYRLEVSYNDGSYSLVANTGTATSRDHTIPTNTSYSTIRYRVRAESGGRASGWVYSNTLIIEHPVTISASPASRGWEPTDVTVTVSIANATSAKYIWTTSTAKPTSGYSTASAGGFTTTLSSEGTWYLHVEASNSLFSNYQRFGPYRIDKAAASHVSHSITGATYVSGNDYWLKPGTTATIKVRGYDATSGIRLSYLRLYGGGLDTRVSYSYDTNATNPWTGWGTAYNFVSGESSYNSNGQREVTWKVNANSDYKSTLISNVQYYYTDYAGNTIGYNNTGLRLGIDGEAPTITFGTNGSESYKKNHSTTVTVSDAGSGVATRQYAWSTSTTTPTSGWTNFSNGATINTPSGANGDYYLHVRATDNVGNTVHARTGRFRLDNSAPTVSISPADRQTWTPTLDVLIQFSDTGGSEIASSRFAVTESPARPTSGWVNTSSPRTVTLDKYGVWYIHVEVADNAGNITYKYGGPYRITGIIEEISLTIYPLHPDFAAIDQPIPIFPEFPEQMLGITNMLGQHYLDSREKLAIPLPIQPGGVFAFAVRTVNNPDSVKIQILVDGETRDVGLQKIGTNKFSGSVTVPKGTTPGTQIIFVQSITINDGTVIETPRMGELHNPFLEVLDYASLLRNRRLRIVR